MAGQSHYLLAAVTWMVSSLLRTIQLATGLLSISFSFLDKSDFTEPFPICSVTNMRVCIKKPHLFSFLLTHFMNLSWVNLVLHQQDLVTIARRCSSDTKEKKTSHKSYNHHVERDHGFPAQPHCSKQGQHQAQTGLLRALSI